MADVSIAYKGSVIAEMDADGSKTLKTSGCYCDGDIVVEYTSPPIPADRQHSKAWFVSVPTAVARKYTTLVTGDADVAAHCADGTAVAVVLKLTNATSSGLYTVITRNTPDGAPTGNTTYVVGRDGTANTWAEAGNGLNLTSEQSSATGSNYHVLATAKGDLKVMAGATKTNFGGADYLVVFAW